MDKVKSRLCAVLKEVNTEEIKEYSMKLEKMPEPFQGGMVIQLWMGENYPHSLEDLRYEMNNLKLPQEVTAKIDFDKAVLATLESLYGKFAGRTSNMLEGIQGEYLEKNCDHILALLRRNIALEIKSICTVYFVNRIETNSFEIPNKNITVIKKGEQDYLDSLILKDSKLSIIDINEGKLKDKEIFLEDSNFTFAIIVSEKSTLKNASATIDLKLREISTVIHANYVCQNESAPVVCGGKQRRELMQLFNNGQQNDYQISYGISSVFPTYCGNQVKLENPDTERIRALFLDSSKLEQIMKNKFEVCLYHYSLGIQAKTEIAFIHFSIALDALFGQRDQNKESIVKGITSLGMDKIDDEIAEALYNLRCALVHGGTRSINGWTSYRAYKKKHKREPFHDLQKIVAFAVMNWPKLQH